MKLKKKLIIAGIVILAAIAVLLVLDSSNKPEENEVPISARTSTSNSVYSTGSEVIDLIGTGTAINSGIASSTDPSLVFQFASSTDETYWDTDEAAPHRYGATTTAPFLIGASDSLSFEFYYSPANTDSSVTCDFAVSNDDECYIGTLASNAANWYPMLAPTTTPSDINSQLSSHSLVFTNDIAVYHTLTIENINAECGRIQCYNASTTDASLLYVNLRLQ